MKLRGAIVEPMIHVTTLEGVGTEEDPMRLVDWYYSQDGILRAWNDPSDDPRCLGEYDDTNGRR